MAQNNTIVQGSPCKRGHGGLRYLKSRGCVECKKATEAARYTTDPKKKAGNAAWKASNPDKVKRGRAAHYEANKEKILARHAARYAASKEEILAQQHAYRAANKDKISARCAVWRAKNSERVRGRLAKRRALELMQRCVCCEDNAFLVYFDTNWLCSKEAGLDALHVDHIVQLALGGKHCTRNLQILSEAQHKVKTAADARQRADFRTRARLLKAWVAPLEAEPVEDKPRPLLRLVA